MSRDMAPETLLFSGVIFLMGVIGSVAAVYSKNLALGAVSGVVLAATFWAIRKNGSCPSTQSLREALHLLLLSLGSALVFFGAMGLVTGEIGHYREIISGTRSAALIVTGVILIGGTRLLRRLVRQMPRASRGDPASN